MNIFRWQVVEQPFWTIDILDLRHFVLRRFVCWWVDLRRYEMVSVITVVLFFFTDSSSQMEISSSTMAAILKIDWCCIPLERHTQVFKTIFSSLFASLWINCVKVFALHFCCSSPIVIVTQSDQKIKFVRLWNKISIRATLDSTSEGRYKLGQPLNSTRSLPIRACMILFAKA